MLWLFRKKPSANTAVIIAELEHAYALVAKLNIPAVTDDFDSGYDMAIDEVLDLIEGRIKFHKNPTMENV